MGKLSFASASLLLLLAALGATPARAITPSAPLVEQCPDVEDVGEVDCYPLTFRVFTKVHPAGNAVTPDGVPVTAWLFVPRGLDLTRTHPAIVFAHGSGSMYSSGRHNRGLNSKHQRWVRQYSAELGFVSLHVDSFHSRYLLPDTPGATDLDATAVPDAAPGGDDYFAEATNNAGLDPLNDGWSDSSNGRDGVSEILERPYDVFGGYDVLVGAREAALFPAGRSTGQTLAANYVAGASGDLQALVGAALTIDPARVFLYGTSHGGQTAMTAAHAGLALAADNPMGPGARFAGFLDFYGGCGLFGAFGGADEGSAWRPSAPFLMLHGEMDTTIWDDVPLDRARWEAEDCAPRLAAAKADPDFDVFLESIVYAGARHSFEDVWRDDVGATGVADPDYPDWRTKLHSNYQIAVPFMEALQRIAFARARGDDVPTLAALGFAADDPRFAALPYLPGNPPVVIHASRGGALPIPATALQGGSFPLGEHIVESEQMHALAWGGSGGADGIAMVSATGELLFDSPTLPARFWLIVQGAGLGSPAGGAVIPVEIASIDATTVGLTFGQGFLVQSEAAPVTTAGAVIDLQGLVRAMDGFPGSHGVTFTVQDGEALPPGLTLEGTRLAGDFAGIAGLPRLVNMFAHLDGQRLGFQLVIRDAGGGAVSFEVMNVTGVEGNGLATPAWPRLDTEPATAPDDPPDVPGEPPAAGGGKGGGALAWLLLPLAVVRATRRR